MLYRMVFGGFIGILNFIWKVFGDDSNDLEVLIKNIKIVNKINKLFLKFLIRFMRKQFINCYFKNVKIMKFVLRNIFFDFIGCEFLWEFSE